MKHIYPCRMGGDRAAAAGAIQARARPAKWTMRKIFDGIFYVLRDGIAWNLIAERAELQVSNGKARVLARRYGRAKRPSKSGERDR